MDTTFQTERSCKCQDPEMKESDMSGTLWVVYWEYPGEREKQSQLQEGLASGCCVARMGPWLNRLFDLGSVPPTHPPAYLLGMLCPIGQRTQWTCLPSSLTHNPQVINQTFAISAPKIL